VVSAALPPLFSAVLQALVGLATASSRRSGQGRWWFAAVCLGSATWSVAGAVALSALSEREGRMATQVAFAAVVVTAPMALAFACRVARRSLRPVVPLFALAVAGAAVIVAVPSWTVVGQRVGGGWWPRPSLATLIVGLLAVGPLAGAVAVTASSYSASSPSLRRRQLGWTLTAILCGVAGIADANTVFSGFYPINWATGFDSKVLRQVIRFRKQDRQEREEQEQVRELYLHALGEI